MLQSVRINFTSFALEDGYDYVRLRDGNNASEPVLQKYTDTMEAFSVTLKTNYVIVEFTTDVDIVNSGFQFTFDYVGMYKYHKDKYSFVSFL